MNSSGSTYGEIDFKQLSNFHKSSCISISKNALLKVLNNQLQASVKIHNNANLISIKNTTLMGTLKAECQFSLPEQPNTSKFFDFIIGADGPYSKVCEMLWAPSEMTQKVYMGIYQTTIPRPPSFPNALMEVWGEENVMGAYPISKKELTVFTTFNPKNDPDMEAVRYLTAQVPSQQMFSRLASWPILTSPPWSQIVSLVSEKPTVQLKYPIERTLSSPPVYHHIGLIGSAAYGTFPLLRGHDLALALEDGYTIAECITHPGLAMDLTLRRFATLRAPRWEQVKQSSYTTTMAAHAQTKDFRMKLKNIMYRWVNSTPQLTERENILISTESIKKSIDILKEGSDGNKIDK